MPFARCMWYNEDGSPIREGCRRVQSGQCDYVHPSEPDWSRARPSKVAPHGAQRNSGPGPSSQRDDGWAQRKSSFGGYNDSADTGTARNGSQSNSGGAWKSTNVPSWDNQSADWGASSSNSNGPNTKAQASSWGAFSWGRPASPVTAADTSSGGWGAPPSPTNTGWGNTTASSGGWGAPPSPTDTGWGNTTASSGGWGNTAVSESAGTDGWGDTTASSGGWGNTAASESTGTGGWGDTTASRATGDGWASTGTWGRASRDASDSGTTETKTGWGSSSTKTWGARPDSSRTQSSGHPGAAARQQPHHIGSSSRRASRPASMAGSDADGSQAGGWSGVSNFINGLETSAPLAGSASSVHESTLMDVDEAVSSRVDRISSLPLPEGPARTVQTLVNAVIAYREWEEARTTYARQRGLSKGKYYEHASPRVREELRDFLKQAQERCEATRTRRDDVLRKLESCGAFLGLESAASSSLPPDSALEDDLGESLSTMQEYVVGVRDWLGNVRPQLEEFLARRHDHTSHPASDRADDIVMVPSQDVEQHPTPIRDALNRLEGKLSNLEDFQESLRTSVAESLNRVDDYFPPTSAEEQEVGLSAAEASLTNMSSQLAAFHQQIGQLSSQTKASNEIEIQRLRAEQETLKLRIMELEQTQKSLAQEHKSAQSSMDEMKATVEGIRISNQPTFLLPDGGLDVEDIIRSLEPLVHSQARQDVQQAIVQIKVGFEEAYTQQHEKICAAVWKRLWPALKVIKSIQQHFDIVVDSVPDDPLLQADAPEHLGPVTQS